MEQPKKDEQKIPPKDKLSLERSNFTILTEQEISKQSLEKSQRELLQAE